MATTALPLDGITDVLLQVRRESTASNGGPNWDGEASVSVTFSPGLVSASTTSDGRVGSEEQERLDKCEDP